MSRNKRGTGLMPNRAARQLVEAIDTDIADSVGQAVRSGVLKQQQAEAVRTRLHFERVDRWFLLLEKVK
jgi:hypothetical protein